MTLGGGFNKKESIDLALNSGVDKVFFNSAVLNNPKLIKEFSEFMLQCIVISIA